MAFSNGYIIGFAGGICVVCSLLVSGAAVSLKDLQDTNRERDLRSSILDALQLVPDDGSVVGDVIDQVWDDRVEIEIVRADGTPADASEDLDGDGDVDLDDANVARTKAEGGEVPSLLALYKRMDDGTVGAYAIPVYGKGLWGPVSGYLALSADVSEVIGVTFFAPKETPGLGAEIQAPNFQEQWEGKKVFRDGKPAGIRVAKGSASDAHAADIDHWVDGVSGATITSRGVDAMVVEGIEQNYAATLARLRQ